MAPHNQSTQKHVSQNTARKGRAPARGAAALALAAALLAIATLSAASETLPTAHVTIRSQRIPVEVAETATQKALGLGERDALAPNHGMLFPYPKADYYTFWMKGMRFDLDIVWIREKQIVDITANVPAPRDTTLVKYRPRVPADQVLEVAAGMTKRHGWTIGDTVRIELPKPASAR